MMRENLAIAILMMGAMLACAPQAGPPGHDGGGEAAEAPVDAGTIAGSASDAAAGQEKDTLWLKGMFSYMADAALFTDCVTNTRYPVAMERDYLALERAYLEQQPGPGAPLLITFEGRLERRPPMEGDGTVETVIVERFHRAWPGQECP
jgi:uncharacterized lipoprotein NlpE involved in copper resistance